MKQLEMAFLKKVLKILFVHNQLHLSFINTQNDKLLNNEKLLREICLVGIQNKLVLIENR